MTSAEQKKKLEIKRPRREKIMNKYSRPGFIEVRPGKFIRTPTPPKVP